MGFYIGFYANHSQIYSYVFQPKNRRKLKELKPCVVRNFAVSRIGYFGSYAKGEQHIGSDLDLLVEFS